ncbi:MAG: c-type cytochrome, partial [Acidobacteriota bacterium]|nr:c-type cytochrome [Acidobacteriota bacterium]
MKPIKFASARVFIGSIVAVPVVVTLLLAQTASFHHAPASAAAVKNPYPGEQNAQAGREVFLQKCAACHGQNGQGTGIIPALTTGPAQTAKPGEIFWYITHGDMTNGMPAWNGLPEKDRWQVVTYLKNLPSTQPAPPAATSINTSTQGTLNAPPPKPPFTDFRFEKPGTTRKITVADLPAPFATASAGNGPSLVLRPANAWPQAPNGFKVELYATGLENPRLIRTAPNGDLFVAESEPGRILVFRGITPDGKPEITSIFASGLDHPFGIAFYPLGPNPQWVYVGDTNAVV